MNPYLCGVLERPLWQPAELPLHHALRVSVDVLVAVVRDHLPDEPVVEVHVEVGRDLPAVLHIEEREHHEEGLHLRRRGCWVTRSFNPLRSISLWRDISFFVLVL